MGYVGETSQSLGNGGCAQGLFNNRSIKTKIVNNGIRIILTKYDTNRFPNVYGDGFHLCLSGAPHDASGCRVVEARGGDDSRKKRCLHGEQSQQFRLACDGTAPRGQWQEIRLCGGRRLGRLSRLH